MGLDMGSNNYHYYFGVSLIIVRVSYTPNTLLYSLTPLEKNTAHRADVSLKRALSVCSTQKPKSHARERRPERVPHSEEAARLLP